MLTRNIRYCATATSRYRNYSTLGDKAKKVGDSISEGIENLKNKTDNALKQSSDKGEELKDQADDLASKAKSKVKKNVNENL